jgi:hypothetical protein
MKKMVFILLLAVIALASCGTPAPQDVQLLESGAPQITLTNRQLISTTDPTVENGAWFRLQIPTTGSEPVKLAFTVQVEQLEKALNPSDRECIATPQKRVPGHFQYLLRYSAEGLRILGEKDAQITLSGSQNPILLLLVLISSVPGEVNISFKLRGGPADGELVALPSVLVVSSKLRCGIPF